MKALELTGQRFGRLTVLNRAENIKGKTAWNCVCDCGNQLTVSANNLKRKNTTSCGCYRTQQIIKSCKTHGMSRKRIYFRWIGMKRRCFNKNDKQFKDYGGRGITVCPEWINDFEAYYKYLSTLPHFCEPGYSIDRINNDGNYEPENIRWATAREQRLNQRKRSKK